MSESQIELSLDEEIEMSKARTAELVERKNKELIEKRAAALAPVLAAIREHGFTAAELGFTARVSATKRESAAPKAERATIEPKYQDPESGAVWSGRGKTPAWMARKLEGGKAKEDFLIVKSNNPPALDGGGNNLTPDSAGPVGVTNPTADPARFIAVA